MSDGLPRTITLDANKHRAIDPASSERELVDRAHYGTQMVYRCEVKDYPTGGGDPTVHDLTGHTFRFVVDDTYGAHADLVITAPDDFNNAGDWSAVDLAQGKICWPADFLTSPLQAVMAVAQAVKKMRAELWALKPGATKWVVLAAWDIEIVNTVAGLVTDDPPDPVETFVTEGELAARLPAGVVFEALPDGSLSVKVNGIERGPI